MSIETRGLLALAALVALVSIAGAEFHASVLATMGIYALLGLSLAPMFPSFIALTPGRMGQAHAANAVGFQVSAAVLGGTALVSGFGLLADRFGLATFGPYLLAAALLLAGIFLILERGPAPAADPVDPA